MPIMTIHLKEGVFSEDQYRELLDKSAQYYAQVLESPIERTRIFINTYQGNRMAVAGKIMDGADDKGAPFFEFLVLAGRPLEQKHELLTGMTDLIESILKVERSLIRGICYPVPPEEWAIAGTPASILRAKEIEARKQQQ